MGIEGNNIVDKIANEGRKNPSGGYINNVLSPTELASKTKTGLENYFTKNISNIT